MLRKPHKRVLILCEGNTEYYYAMALKATLPRNVQRSVGIEPNIHHPNDPKSLAEEAVRRSVKAKAEGNPFTQIWLFFDNDNHPLLEQAFRIIAKKNFCIAYSSLCIECWFILHFEECGRAFADGAEAKAYLKRLWPEYHKTKIKHYEMLKEQVDDAVRRAQAIRRRVDEGIPLHQRNPYITVDVLVDFIRSMTTNT